MKIVMDFDDFCDEYNEMESLLFLRKKNGSGFKVTLFTIPGKCSPDFLKRIKTGYPWIEMAIHGWNHEGIGECSQWTRIAAKKYMQKALNTGFFTPGFKAPNWLANKEVYLACKDLGIWVAELKAHQKLIPEGVRSYILEGPGEEGLIHSHGHITNYPQNYIKTHLLDYVYGKKNQYYFISEILNQK